LNQASAPGRDNIRLAVAAILITVFALSLGDAAIKSISAGFPLWQIFVLRSLIAMPVLVALARLRDPACRLIPRAPGWAAVRSLMLTVMWIAYYAALPHVVFSAAAAVYYTLPLFITLFSALLVGERVRPVGWTAVVMGFAGVLLILKPRGEDFNAYALLPLVSAILYALAMILTRTRCRGEDPVVLSLALNAAMLGVGGVATLAIWVLEPSVATVAEDPFLFGGWIGIGAREWAVMGLLAGAVIIGSVGAAIAYQSGPSAIVSTFDFAYLAFAALWGFLFFNEVADAVTVTGMVLIAVAGILTLWKR
jgi:drug/metabolite transporter (DMT)-like permease